MATLPYSKTTIRDLSSFTNIGDGLTSLNIATIINAETGPMERVTLRGFDDLVDYFCTGTKVTATDDVTIQTLGALLNTTSVDVIRVGKSDIKIGKTDKGHIIYTDSDYNLIDTLTKLKITDNSVRENSLAVFFNDEVYYVGDQPSIEGAKLTKVGDEVTLISLIKGIIGKLPEEEVISYNDNSIYLTSGTNKVVDTDLTTIRSNLVEATKKLENIKSSGELQVGTEVLIGSNTYIYTGDGTQSPDISVYDNPVSINGPTNTATAAWFLARVISKLESSSLAAEHVQYDFSGVSVYSENLNNRIIDGIFTYNKSDRFDTFYCIKNDTAYLYNVTEDVVSGESYSDIQIINADYTDIIDIFNEFEVRTGTKIFTLVDDVYCYLSDVTVTIDSISNFLSIEDSEGVTRLDLEVVEYIPSDYSVFVDGTVYYCGIKEPADTYRELEVREFVLLSVESLTYNDFVKKLFSQLEADRIIGRLGVDSIYLQGECVLSSSDNLTLTTSLIDQTKIVEDSKFAVVSRFPTSQKLFNFSFVKNTEIEEYEVVNITYTYNQVTDTVPVSFQSDAVDGYGNVLYYSKYNEGTNSNMYVYFLELNTDVETPLPEEEVNISGFGNELIMPTPEATDYANAIKKFLDYEDKFYSFIWDSGYCSPVLAKAMIGVGQEISAQVVPSFPTTYKKVEDIINYDESIGANTFQVVKVVPGHKSTYCGSFLTAVPGSLSYIVARVNSFNNSTSEFQPLFGATRGAVTAPNLIWNINKKDQQLLADRNINSIVNNINGTYLNFNLTSQKATSYLSEEQNVYMSNVIAHVCQEFNPTLIAELNNKALWDKVVSLLTTKLNDRLVSGKNPTINAFRVICDGKLNTQASIEARQLKYKVEVQYLPSASYILCYVDVVRLNSF